MLAARGDSGDVEFVRTAWMLGVPTIVVALPSGASTNLIVDGQHGIGALNGALTATVRATIGGPIDAGLM